MMFLRMFHSEWRFFTKQPSFYVSALIFFCLALGSTGFQKLVNDLGTNVNVNGPYFITQITALMGIFSLFLVVNFMGNTALRDHTSNMAEILYCKPFHRLSYMLGRFFGAYAAIVFIYAMVPMGLFIGSFMPWVSLDRVGDYQMSHYLLALIYLAIPSLFVFSSLFYTVATKLKSMMSVYMVVIAVFVLYGFSETLFMSHRDLAALLDPFAERTFSEVSRYWTNYEKNNEVLSFSGVLLQNRLIWVAIAVAILLVPMMNSSSLSINSMKLSKPKTGKEKKESVPAQLLNNRITYTGQVNVFFAQLIARTRFEVEEVILSRTFKILCTAVFCMMIAILFQPKGMFNTTELPYTQIMVQVIQGSMRILGFIIITYYTAEVVWRERQSGMAELAGSMPTSNLAFWLAKLFAVWAVLFLLLVFAMKATITYQLLSGFSELDMAQYVTSLFYFTLPSWMMMTVLAFFLQSISPNKFVGMFLFVLFLVSDLIMEPLGLGHNMFRFAKTPVLTYTDLNGFGWALTSQFWYLMYWGSLSCLLAILSYSLWQRSDFTPLKHRLAQLSKCSVIQRKWPLVTCTAVFALAGSVIFYNTKVLNPYQTAAEKNWVSAEYEKSFGHIKDAPIPMIQKLDLEVDLYPEQREVVINANFEVKNKSQKVIDKFLISLPYIEPEEFGFEIAGGKLINQPLIHNSYWFEFETPLLPGESRAGTFNLVRKHEGFKDTNYARRDVDIVENGTFFEGGAMLPVIGYQPSLQLVDPALRKEHELPPAPRMAKLEDARFYHQSSMGPDVNFIEFEATVSTSSDQTAITPGNLIREWQQDGRNYFYYQARSPMEYFISVMSGRFEKKTSHHNGVELEVFYHKTHDKNVERMLVALKDSLDYFSESFGPYPHQHARVIEFPGYANYAQSFPNTIAFSERIGFITDMTNEDEIDKIYYVIAHEMAHQWWGNQVSGANVQGSTMIVETLAQYSALMLFRKTYGEAKFRRIMKLELDRYLRGRTNEVKAEVPLMRVENQQYIHYNKGSVVMMALVDQLGETKVNQVLKKFVKQYRYQSSPYPTTLDLLRLFDEVATVEEQSLMHRLFAEINLYDLKAESASVEALSDGQYQVNLVVNAERLLSDSVGNEEKVELREQIDIGLFVQDPNSPLLGNTETPPVYLQKHRIRSGKNEIQLIVPNKPSFVGIDPYIKFIDRDSDDNILAI